MKASPKSIEVYFYKSRGPGGQRKNKKETAVRIRHIPTGIIVRATENRSQARNKELALERLKKRLLNRRKVKKKRIPTRKPYSVRMRELESKRKHAFKKQARQKVV